MTRSKGSAVKKRNSGQTSETYVYLCFDRNDGRWYATALSALLEEIGYKVLADPDLSATRTVEASFLRTLRAASAIVFIGTPRAYQSDFVFFELKTFIKCQPHGLILPILFDPVPLGESEILSWIRDRNWMVEESSRLKSGPSERVLVGVIAALKSAKPSSLAFRPFGEELPKEPKRSLGEGKLILVGRGEVGKTSIVNRLLNHKFREGQNKTQGINISQWQIRSGRATARLNVWDFGGQEIMHATHQFFLTERSVYLLILNGRGGGEDEDAEYWMKHIVAFGGDSPVIVILNKIKQHGFELNYRGLQARYPQIREFLKTDCRDNTGIENLERAIRRAVTEMPLIRMQIPVRWFKVKDRLEASKANFISYEKFNEICGEQGVTDQADRDSLSILLHCLGIALNYKDDWRLSETSVLKPEWVTRGIYGILNAKSISESQGELNVRNLASVLPSKTYPARKHGFLLELMRKFSLCFAFPDDADRYLVPDLLGKEEPEEALQFEPKKCLNFEYSYEVLPEGLLPRFIVRSHALSRNQSRWRTGVILSHEGCRALVKAEVGSRKVLVRIQGDDAEARRRLLAIIRYDFDRINSEFKDRLDVKPRVPLIDHPNVAIDYKKLVAFEKEGLKQFPEVIEDSVVVVDVQELLWGVDLPAQRKPLTETVVGAKAVFFSYSHKDENLRDELEVHLKLLQRQGFISTWTDRKITPGTNWKREIDVQIEKAQIILLLISADFIASEYCWGKEATRALERHKAGQATVIPISLRPCDCEGAPFKELQGLPLDFKAVTEWPNRDAAWTDVAKGIRAVADQGWDSTAVTLQSCATAL